MGKSNGCAETVMVIITVFLGFFTNSTPAAPQLDEENYVFGLAEVGVIYSFRETFNCQFIISGNVEFFDNNTVDSENIVIKLQPLATYDNRAAATAFIGIDNSYGLIVVGNYHYLVWVHDLSLDMPLSKEILVDNLDCSERTQATLNFRQTQGYHHDIP